jgi:hypothetical protein
MKDCCLFSGCRSYPFGIASCNSSLTAKSAHISKRGFLVAVGQCIGQQTQKPSAGLEPAVSVFERFKTMRLGARGCDLFLYFRVNSQTTKRKYCLNQFAVPFCNPVTTVNKAMKSYSALVTATIGDPDLMCARE